MKKLLLIVGIAVGMNASVALAQHETMPGHDKMPAGDHSKHDKKKGGDSDKKKDGDSDKKKPPKTTTGSTNATISRSASPVLD